MASLEEAQQGGDLLNAIEAAVRDANRKLHEMVGRDPSLKGMGTTLTAMLWHGTQVALVHVGDSRAYLLRRGELYQITHDHTLVQQVLVGLELVFGRHTTNEPLALIWQVFLRAPWLALIPVAWLLWERDRSTSTAA